MKTVLLSLIGLLIVLAMPACTTVKEKIVTEKFPTISHVHIGHAITGWEYTSDKSGLFQVTEKEADIALIHAGNALKGPLEINLIKLHVRDVMHAVNPESQKKGAGFGFGLKRALTESVSHITYAAESDDASENVQNFAKHFTRNSVATLDRCDLILALGEEVLSTVTTSEAISLAKEILNLASANVDGIDTDGNGDIGSNPSEYGLKQLRRQIDAMVKREDPPYRTVAKRYLFGLIRLPSGKWIFSFSKKKSGSRKGSYGGR